MTLLAVYAIPFCVSVSIFRLSFVELLGMQASDNKNLSRQLQVDVMSNLWPG
jgi:hypothetical protein